MIKKITSSLFFLALVSFGLTGCEEEEEGSAETAGIHFQGKDCLACHNIDLKSDKHLTIAGTLYKSHDILKNDSLDDMCGGSLYVRFIETTTGVDYNASSYSAIHQESDGIDGKGNFFVLKREISSIPSGNYAVQIWSEDGYLLAASKDAHPISNSGYSISNSSDSSNRLSCNACHKINGSALPLYVQQNSAKCQ